jgi:multidrug efflux system outer membrane protein
MTTSPLRRTIAVLTATAILAGCAIGPDYKRPALTPPDTFRGQTQPDAPSLADLPWWDVFDDPALRGLIQEAIASNYDLRIAAARVAQARAQAGIARAAYFPVIGYQGSVQRSKEFEAFLGISGDQIPNGGASNLFLGVLTASWEIDVWGQIRRSNEAALAQLLATEDAQRGVLLSLVSEVAQSYFQLVELDQRLEISRQSTQAYQGIYDLFRDRLEYGVVSQLQTSRAEGSLASAAATIPEVQAQIAAKENQISTLLGKNPGPIPRGTPLFSQRAVPTVPTGLPSELLERRPDLRKAEQQLVAANAQIGVAKAEFFPKLSLTGFLGKASPEMAMITAGSSTIWSIAAGLAGPIFQGGRILENYRATLAVWEQARWQYEQTVITAFQEVASSLDALDKLSTAEAEQARAVAALEKSVQLATDRYLYGLASYLEVLDAQNRLFPAQNAQASIRLNRLTAYVQLYKALGGGWNVKDPQSPPTASVAEPRAACAGAGC